jgi:hypothetical protein
VPNPAARIDEPYHRVVAQIVYESREADGTKTPLETLDSGRGA